MLVTSYLPALEFPRYSSQTTHPFLEGRVYRALELGFRGQGLRFVVKGFRFVSHPAAAK